MTGGTSQFCDYGCGWRCGITRPRATWLARFGQSPQPGWRMSTREQLSEWSRMHVGVGSGSKRGSQRGSGRMACGVWRGPRLRLRRIAGWAEPLPELQPADGVR
jgi:hypothetical protein